ncbi:MAG: phosphoenolpyruvate carboxykinase (ATP), partial [Planctomycetia bacterium]|nr:phosphoenolpyruvate carboxykinase (ATP) [Planctomycetia bacterium]
AQVMYHFVSGYSAKVAGTEMGVTEPAATFSACFGAPFMVWHPTVYAELLAEKMHRHAAEAWLVNTGWTGCPHGVGRRINLAHTRAIIDAIHAGTLGSAATQEDPIFGLAVPTACPGVPKEILIPRNTWTDPAAYDRAAEKLARLFHDNFAQYLDHASPETAAAGPRVGTTAAAR